MQAFIAAFTCGYFVFGENNKVNMQVLVMNELQTVLHTLNSFWHISVLICATFALLNYMYMYGYDQRH